jgi:hypothetical protein
LSVIVDFGKQAIGSIGFKNFNVFEELATSSLNLANRSDGAPNGHRERGQNTYYAGQLQLIEL